MHHAGGRRSGTAPQEALGGDGRNAVGGLLPPPHLNEDSVDPGHVPFQVAQRTPHGVAVSVDPNWDRKAEMSPRSPFSRLNYMYQAGADPHLNDPMGGWLTTEQLRECAPAYLSPVPGECRQQRVGLRVTREDWKDRVDSRVCDTSRTKPRGSLPVVRGRRARPRASSSHELIPPCSSREGSAFCTSAGCSRSGDGSTDDIADLQRGSEFKVGGASAAQTFGSPVCQSKPVKAEPNDGPTWLLDRYVGDPDDGIEVCDLDCGTDRLSRSRCGESDGSIPI
jgi:hypothetical protein